MEQTAKEFDTLAKTLAAIPDVPIGISPEQFAKVTALVQAHAAEYGTDIAVHGSRASGQQLPSPILISQSACLRNDSMKSSRRNSASQIRGAPKSGPCFMRSKQASSRPGRRDFARCGLNSRISSGWKWISPSFATEVHLTRARIFP